MLVLAVHGGYKRVDEENRVGFVRHDSAALLVEDGEVLAAIEEERLDRLKHSNCFPTRAIRYCLDQHRITLKDVHWITTNHEEHTGLGTYARMAYLEEPDHRIPPDGRKFFASLFAHEFGVDVSTRLRFCNHHLAHAWSAYVPSGYDNALIVVLDGDGDWRSGMVFLCEGGKMVKLRELGLNQSLGNLYTALIKLLGYNRFDEYKVMGLAPYGDPSLFSGIFEKCYQLLPEGNYSLGDRSVWMSQFEAAGLLAGARRKGAPLTQTHMDIAAAIQATLERMVFHILAHYQKVTRQQRLCLAGGVAHNCTLNGKILYSGLFDDVFVQPAAHDAGGALGAAYAVLNHEESLRRRGKAGHLFFGTDAGTDASIAASLEAWTDFLSFERVDCVAETAADLLAAGNVIGWVQGRSEFGPRALGNRSILADPRPAENKTLVNEMIKKRESYRPFAPSVLEERVRDFFDVPGTNTDYPFMIFVVRVREEARTILGAITHVDCTARLHSVSKQANPLYHQLISEFGKRTGVPVLLNTSFNNNVEPIVDSAQDAIVCYLTTGLHYLVIGNYVVNKKAVGLSHPAHMNLTVSLPRSRILSQRQCHVRGDQWKVIFEMQSTVARFFAPSPIEVSEEMFRLLLRADGAQPLSALLDAEGIRNCERITDVIREIRELWSKRAIIVRPVRNGYRAKDSIENQAGSRIIKTLLAASSEDAITER